MYRTMTSALNGPAARLILAGGLFSILALSSSPVLAQSITEEAAAAPTAMTSATQAAPAPAAVAEQPAAEQPSETALRGTEEPIMLRPVRVIGLVDNADNVPGSAHVIGHEQLERQNHSDPHRILREVPGVYVEEEEGFGLRPHIGMRGTGVERTQKITIMEDGVLASPAPYAAPAAYIFPMIGRMERVEIRKGSAAIKHGPYTIGGAINMKSTSIPQELGAHADIAFGERRSNRTHLHVGDSQENFGWILEGLHMGDDGFKNLDGGGPTGFRVQDYVGQFRLNSGPDAARYQEVVVKLGWYDEASDETYLGLTEADYAADPFRRYAASQEDRLDVRRRQGMLRHYIELGSRVDLTTTVYRTQAKRSWYKLDKVGGESIGSVLANPEAFADQYAIISGQTSEANALQVKNNNREYYSQGVETQLNTGFDALGMTHQLDFGLRFHQDAEDRFQHSDGYQMFRGAMALTEPGTPGTGSGNNRIGSADAFAGFVYDQATVGAWTFSLGSRLERIFLEREDYGGSDPERAGEAVIKKSAVTAVMPGGTVKYAVNDQLSVFTGVHRGFSPPGPGAADETRPESSVNTELGARYVSDALRTEIVGFFNRYTNLLGADTLAGGGEGTGDLFNGGRADISGVEATLSYDAGIAADLPVNIPAFVNYTYTDARFRTSFTTSYEDWSPRVEDGDYIPFVPLNQVSGGIGLARPGLGDVWLNGTWRDKIRTRAGKETPEDAEVVPAYFVMDLAAGYDLDPNKRLYVNVRNLLNEEYIAALRPAGLRPGMPRTVMGGVKFSF